MTTVLITRPRATAEPLAQELERLGYRAAIEPLLSIVPLDTVRPLGSCEASIITSGNALSALETRREKIGDLFGLPCFCVGSRTAGMTRQFGFRDVKNTESDGVELARSIGITLAGRRASILHPAARDADSKARQELERQGHHVMVWPVYKAVSADDLTAASKILLAKQQLDAIVIFSPRTAATFVELLAFHALEACCASLAAICLSEAVADVLRPLPWRQLAVASAPTENAIIARLQEICPVKS